MPLRDVQNELLAPQQQTNKNRPVISESTTDGKKVMKSIEQFCLIFSRISDYPEHKADALLLCISNRFTSPVAT